MIQEIVDRFMANKDAIRAEFANKFPSEYVEIVQAVVKHVTSEAYSDLDPQRIHTINDGSYQGTLVYVIGAKGYQPSDYWYVKVGYGSCSGCDTLESIRGYSDEISESKLDDLMTLALHIVQGLKKMGDDIA